MTSLVLTTYRPWPPAGGAPLRNWQNIRVLGRFGPVDVITVAADDVPAVIPGIREWVPFPPSARSLGDRLATWAAPLRRGVHPGIDRYRCREVRRWLRRAHGRYDLAVLETISVAAYLPDLRRVAARIVYDAHNVESPLHAALTALDGRPRAVTARVKGVVLQRRMTAAERRVVCGADLVWTCSEPDTRQLETLYGRRHGISMVPNAVDVEAYRRPGVTPPGADWNALPLTMVYPGVFTYQPNEEAALRLIRDVLPAVRRSRPDARVVLVGRDPTPALIVAAERAGGVEVTGEVPAVLPFLEQPCVVALPIATGSGTRLKIVEAFAVGRPVVSTSKGAEGIHVENGRHLLMREDAGQIAAAVLELWERPEMRARLCDAALAFVRSELSWSCAADRIVRSLALESQPAARCQPLPAQTVAAQSRADLR